ncbi:hypothetical protein TNCV_1970411 [Trichonephila clavipes]|uniref:Uncharacterized protein n=1 Tax=Trichonephila clavipes TaxID=2585209 RepID=A0A8X6W5S9_TRICX|nr:hypothetical protein TNCV_1970411 [Trichonephila clavipes]
MEYPFQHRLTSYQGGHYKDPVVYRGIDAPKIFIEKLEKDAIEIDNIYKKSKPLLPLTESEKQLYDNANNCYVCGQTFHENNIKQQERTTQLGSRNETTQLVSRNETTQLVSRNETTQLCTAVNRLNRLQPPTTACNRLQPPTTAYDRLRPPATACNRLHRLQPPATACNRLHRLHRLYSRIGFFYLLPSYDTFKKSMSIFAGFFQC